MTSARAKLLIKQSLLKIGKTSSEADVLIQESLSGAGLFFSRAQMASVLVKIFDLDVNLGINRDMNYRFMEIFKQKLALQKNKKAYVEQFIGIISQMTENQLQAKQLNKKSILNALQHLYERY